MHHVWAAAMQPRDVHLSMPRLTGKAIPRATHFHVYRARVATTQSQDESSLNPACGEAVVVFLQAIRLCAELQ